ncbi:hypothetical protein QEN19_004152 [Hanseniaspora menglaensis]
MPTNIDSFSAQTPLLGKKKNMAMSTILPSIKSLLNGNDNSKPDAGSLPSMKLSSTTPLPGMVSVSRASNDQPLPQTLPNMSSSTYVLSSANNGLRTDSFAQQQIQAIQQPNYIQQQPVPQYRVVNGYSAQLPLEMNKIPSPINRQVSLTVPVASNRNLSIPLPNANNSDSYKHQISPFIQTRNYTRNSSTNQATPLSANTTIYRQNSRSGYTPMSSVFSQFQDISNHATPINRTQFAGGKQHRESFSSPQMIMSSQISDNTRTHYRSVPVIYQHQQKQPQQHRTLSLNHHSAGVNLNSGNIPQVSRKAQQYNQQSPTDVIMQKNSNMTQQYQIIQPQHIIHNHQQQNLHQYQYQHHYSQLPAHQEYLQSNFYVSMNEPKQGKKSKKRVSFSNYDGFNINMIQPVSSQTPPLMNQQRNLENYSSDVSPKRMVNSSFNISENNTYNSEMIEVEVETETPIKRIPRPRNAFILFRQHYHRLIFKEQTEKITSEKKTTACQKAEPAEEELVDSFKLNSSVSKTIGIKWKSLSEEEKKQWCDLAEKEKADHQLKYPDYKYVPRRKKGTKRL